MTIDSSYIGELFEPNGVGPYTFTFEVLEASNIQVAYVFADNTTIIEDPANYTVVLQGVGPIFQGGTVTLDGAPAAEVTAVSISRNTFITQLMDYQPYDPFPAETHEFGLDKLTMICQELNVKVGIALQGSGGGGGVSDIYVPLAGTVPGRPITGALEFRPTGANGPVTISYAKNAVGGGDALLFNAQGDNTNMIFNTRTPDGVVQGFAFSANGSLILPSQEEANTESWSIGAAEVLGTPNTLLFVPQDAIGNQVARNVTFAVASGLNFTFHEDIGNGQTRGYLQLPRSTVATDDPLAAVTKDYVDGVIPPGGGEANTASNAGAGVGIWARKEAVDLVFRSLVGGIDIDVALNGDEITLNYTGGGGGTDFIPLTGTLPGNPVTGQIVMADSSSNLRFLGNAGLSFGNLDVQEPNVDVSWQSTFATLAFTPSRITVINYTFGCHDGVTQRNIELKSDGSMLLGTKVVNLADDTSVLTLGWWKDEVLAASSVNFDGDINTNNDVNALGGVTAVGSIETQLGQFIHGASQGSAGNVSTRKDYVDGLDNQNVKLTGNQQISGIKDFNSRVDVNNGMVVSGGITVLSTGLQISGGQSTFNELVQPGLNNEVDLGTTFFRWRTLYTNNTPNISDERLKQDVRQMSDAERRAACEVRQLFVSYRLKEEGDDGKIRFGVIAQDVIDVMSANGLDATQYAFLHKAGEYWNIDYRELQAFITTAEMLS